MKHLALLIVMLVSSLAMHSHAQTAIDIVNSYNDAVNTKSLDDMSNLFADDAMIYGSTPSEKWTKEVFLGLVEKTFSMPKLKIKNEVLDTEEINLGDKTIVMQTIMFSRISRIVPSRTVYVLEHTSDGPRIKFLSFSLSPEGKDLITINRYLSAEKTK